QRVGRCCQRRGVAVSSRASPMLDPARLLAASATVERLLSALAALLVVALLLRARRAPGPPTRGQLEIGARAERAAMLAVLTWVLVARLVGSTFPPQPR